MTEIRAAAQALYAELEQRCLNGEFSEACPSAENFSKKMRKGRGYWYVQGYQDGRRYSRYVGPADDPEVAARIQGFLDLKADFADRRRMVATLKATGLPSPDAFTGNLVEALAKAGLFRLGGVLIGPPAFQCYAGHPGLRRPPSRRNSSVAIAWPGHEDGQLSLLDIVRQVDGDFQATVGLVDTRQAMTFRNGKGFQVEFLDPTVSPREVGDHDAAVLPAGSGTAAQSGGLLDFLVQNPIRSVLLHNGGIPVRVPAAERYAIHSLIAAVHRPVDPAGRLEASKDLVEAGILIEALVPQRHTDVAEAFLEAWSRGSECQDALAEGVSRLPAPQREILADAVQRDSRSRERTRGHLPSRAVHSSSRNTEIRSPIAISSAKSSGFFAELHHGDCMEMMKQLPGGSVDLIFTSPPYNLGTTSGGGFPTGEKTGKWNGGTLSEGYGAHSDRMPHEKYAEWQRIVLKECWRLLSPTGAIFYNHKPRVQDGTLVTPLELNPGLPLRQIITWKRAGGINFSPSHYLPTHEWIMIFAKKDFRLRDKAASGAKDIWEVPQEQNNPHPAPFPLELPSIALETTTAQVVLDPFMGSGTTGIACHRHGRRFIGIELDRQYFDMAVTRISNAVSPPVG